MAALIGAGLLMSYWWGIGKAFAALEKEKEVLDTHNKPPFKPSTNSVSVTEDISGRKDDKVAVVPPQPINSKPKPKLKPTEPLKIFQAPYGNLAHRCEELGNALIAMVQDRMDKRPDPITHKDGYKNWYRENDGLGFRMHFYDDVIHVQQELHSVHVDDPRLDDLIKKT
jgi:hypothetical protein